MGHSLGNSDQENGVTGTSGSAAGVLGKSVTWNGVKGESTDNAGVAGVSEKFVGVWAESHGEGHAGLFGISDRGPGVTGESKAPNHAGVWGKGSQWTGVVGTSVDQSGVSGVSEKFVGVWAESHGEGHAGLFGISDRGPGVTGESKAPNHAGVWGKGRIAGYFEGDVHVTGELHLPGADYAEALDAVDPNVPAGTVVVVGGDGRVHPCDQDYDPAVAGIVSGAGDTKPAIVLDPHEHSVTVAMMGKVWCLADADHGPVRPGNLLTTSTTVGHARTVTEPMLTPGTVIGKALTALPRGRGLVRVLVNPC